MFKKIKYLLNNFDTIKTIVDNYDKLANAPTEKKNRRVSIAGVPEEQRKFIEENYKIK